MKQPHQEESLKSKILMGGAFLAVVLVLIFQPWAA